ncbi:MAG: ABC transporter ATP-binding protein [Verrucomicrobiota bacterium]
MEIVVKTEKLNRHLGEGANQVHALRDVSLEARRGKTYAIVGHSGSGKSTLLYLLGLLDRPDSGKIEIAGRSTSSLSDEERTALRNQYLGFVFQFHFLIKEFTALENITIPMRKLGQLKDHEMRDKAMSLLQNVGLEEKANRLGNQLSGGEQQRVAIARALANDPAVLLADEPTGNLDHKNADRVFELLSDISHKRGNAFIMVSHNAELAKRCDVVFPMEDGYLKVQP